MKEHIKKSKGLTLIEVILAISISIFIFELVFFVYMSLFRSWDIGFMRGKSEDETRQAVQRISKELRMAETNIAVPNHGVITYYKGSKRSIYLYHPAVSYDDFIAGSGPTSNYFLRLIETEDLADDYGGGEIIAKDIVPPQGTAGGTRFSTSGGLVSLNIVSRMQDLVITLNTAVYPRSVP